MIGIDTMILIWGLQKSHKKSATRQDVEEMRRRAKILLKELDDKNEKIIVSTIAISEFLCGIPAKDHGTVVAAISSQFVCPPFDLRASAYAAQLWQTHATLPKSSQNPDRVHLKADTMIIATAKAAGATEFYSHDEQCRSLAKSIGMSAFDLPTHAESFFTDIEIQEDEEGGQATPKK